MNSFRVNKIVSQHDIITFARDLTAIQIEEMLLRFEVVSNLFNRLAFKQFFYQRHCFFSFLWRCVKAYEPSLVSIAAERNAHRNSLLFIIVKGNQLFGFQLFHNLFQLFVLLYLHVGMSLGVYRLSLRTL